ncbi:calcium-binding protein [Paracoccus aminovorans]|uniref:calcium-binding protein n=1 Tax=Paracoccus aminovorans TaxID=34004 RepID=UPI002B260ACF|nr:calcium-binding protein [Paracoccus aminovorans]
MAVYTGTSGNDNFLGTTGDDSIYGYGGTDNLFGKSGNDYMDGGDGSDKLFGEDGHDTIIGGTGLDYIVGGNGNDFLCGGDDMDTLYGDDGDDYIDGGKGMDYIYAGYGNDTIVVDSSWDYMQLTGDNIDGGAGIDIIHAIDSSGTGSSFSIRLGNIAYVEKLHNTSASKSLSIEGSVTIDLSKISEFTTAGGAMGWIYGGSRDDTIKGFNLAAVGIRDGDSIYGGAGNDAIYGYAGNDLFDGGAGNDTLVGGVGNDRSFGGTGADTFQFKYDANEGADRIEDYSDGTDRIRFTNTGGTVGFGDLALTDIGADCRIDLASGGSVLLVGVSSAVLDAGDFIFS